MPSHIDLTGQTFGLLTVKELLHINKKPGVFWICMCECGNTHTVSAGNLKSGNTKSCGCLKGAEKKYFDLPEWTNFLPNDASMGTKDMKDILGGCSATVNNAVKDGRIPPHDSECLRPGRSPTIHWSMGLLRRFLEDKS